MEMLYKLNVYFGIFWFLLNIFVYNKIDTDLRSNDPLTQEEYLQKGGNEFDYHFGYAFLTSTTDQVRYGIPETDLEHQNRFPPQLRDGSWQRVVCILGPTVLWLIGLYVIAVSADRRTENRPAGACASVMTAITTVMSLYGAYYAVVYVMKFWLL